MKDHMKIFYNILIVAVALLVTSACSKEQLPPAEDIVPETPESERPKGTYLYDGREYPVYSISCVADSEQIYFKISPIEDPQSQTTYAVIGINAVLEGMEIDVARAWHNDDYYFIYEDPVMYYSQYRKLTSGTIFIKRHGDLPEDYQVLADIVLPDDKKFHFEHK